jgi:hypothetical protein
MAGLSFWSLAIYYRHELTLNARSVVSRGALGRKEIGLGDVIACRWRLGPGTMIVLRSERTKVVIGLDRYETEERDRIIDFVREAIPLPLQTGWKLFAYKVRFREPRPDRTEPGPGGIVLRRGRWDRLFGVSLVALGLVATFLWRATGEPMGFATLPVFCVLWAVVRYTTPAKGMIVPEISRKADLDSFRFLRSMLLLALLSVAALLMVEQFRARLSHPDAVAMMVGVASIAGMCIIANDADRRKRRRDLAAADRAARARGEIDAGS